jgi:hypothetical protein
MAKVAGFLEIERRDRKYEPVESSPLARIRAAAAGKGNPRLTHIRALSFSPTAAIQI